MVYKFKWGKLFVLTNNAIYACMLDGPDSFQFKDITILPGSGSQCELQQWGFAVGNTNRIVYEFNNTNTNTNGLYSIKLDPKNLDVVDYKFYLYNNPDNKPLFTSLSN